MPLLPVLRKSPFARLLLFYGSGITVANVLQANHLLITGLAFMIIACLVFLLISISNRSYNTGWVTGSLASLTIFLCGMWAMEIQFRQQALFNSLPETKDTYRIRIIDLPEVRGNRIKATARVLGCIDCGCWKKQNFRILVYLDGCRKEVIDPGYELQINSSLKTIQGPPNPDQYNYRRYLAARQIYREAFVKPGYWKITGYSQRSPQVMACLMRKQLLRSLDKLDLDLPDYGLLSALTLGYKEDVDARTKQVFSKAGVMHIMALSGFNVGIIALALGFILGVLDFNNRWKSGKAIIIIIFLWLFAWVTGLSPSITRATVMLSFVMAGRLFHRRINNYNILFGSAFMLLALSPSMLADVSFQLSIAAVTGIILYQPLLYHFLSFSNNTANRIWQLFTLTCAAQLATLPLTLYYFHQFPVYFWLTNLYVVPLVSLIVCITGVYLAFAFIKPLTFYFGKLLAILLKGLFLSVAIVEDLPFSMVRGINISALQSVMLTFFIIALAAFILYRQKKWLLFSLSVLIIFMGVNTINSIKLNRQQISMVGSLYGESAISIIRGRQSILFLGSARSANDNLLNYAFENFWTKHGIKPCVIDMENTMELDQCDSHMNGLYWRNRWRGNNLLVNAGNERWVILRDSLFYQYHALKPLAADMLVITGSLAFRPCRLAQELKPSMVILDSSIKSHMAKQWKKAIEKLGITCYSIVENGAYIAHSTPDHHR